MCGSLFVEVVNQVSPQHLLTVLADFMFECQFICGAIWTDQIISDQNSSNYINHQTYLIISDQSDMTFQKRMF